MIRTALDKAIAHGKEHRKPYRGSKAIDATCRNHGGCPWCEENRKHKFRDKHPYEPGDDEPEEEQEKAMARLPDGWAYVVREKSFMKISVEQAELVFCQNCKWHGKCDIEPLGGRWDFWCADGERKKEEE